MTVKAYAKVNLILNILGERADGYHEIETVFYAIDLCDFVTVEQSEKTQIVISEKGNALADVPMEDNLAYKALCLAEEEFGISENYRITIEKHIPAAAGLAGGSADGAAVLTALSTLWKVPLKKMFPLAEKLGSDVPFCLASQNGHRSAIGRGRGEILEFIDLPDYDFIFREGPEIKNKTARVYKELREEDCKTPFDIKAFINAETPEEQISLMGNQLQAPLERITGEEVKDMILCGAGPTYFIALPKKQ